MTKKSLLPVLLVPTCILSIPAAAMLFRVEGWAWGVADFIVMWVLIASVILTYKLVTRKAAGGSYRSATGVALFAGLALVWVNGAVGLIGSGENPANLLYAGVLAIGVIGAVKARFEPLGMGWTLFVMTFAQLLVPFVALMVRPGDFSPGVLPVLGLNGVFVLLFAGSALLFWRAARKGDCTRTKMVA
ncbi:hypothetical protein DES53_102968 [Roseimicrobium gellanilyticum]|uniref:Uncharacterized protein n=2 Tax=Roseimicrobium gellanilyticum TaxID=748857 RepID=A0A366HV47_9BACT|nr:hypothetical protein DES53_102968 [Roseimicrobium gellanilyticum]